MTKLLTISELVPILAEERMCLFRVSRAGCLGLHLCPGFLSHSWIEGCHDEFICLFIHSLFSKLCVLYTRERKGIPLLLLAF